MQRLVGTEPYDILPGLFYVRKWDMPHCMYHWLDGVGCLFLGVLYSFGLLSVIDDRGRHACHRSDDCNVLFPLDVQVITPLLSQKAAWEQFPSCEIVQRWVGMVSILYIGARSLIIHDRGLTSENICTQGGRIGNWSKAQVEAPTPWISTAISSLHAKHAFPLAVHHHQNNALCAGFCQSAAVTQNRKLTSSLFRGWIIRGRVVYPRQRNEFCRLQCVHGRSHIAGYYK